MHFATDAVLNEVYDERVRQDEKWGGAEHDNQYAIDAFTRWIADRVVILQVTPDSNRRMFVEIAALAAAAIESIDRRNARAEKQGAE